MTIDKQVVLITADNQVRHIDTSTTVSSVTGSPEAAGDSSRVEHTPRCSSLQTPTRKWDHNVTMRGLTAAASRQSDSSMHVDNDVSTNSTLEQVHDHLVILGRGEEGQLARPNITPHPMDAGHVQEHVRLQDNDIENGETGGMNFGEAQLQDTAGGNLFPVRP